MTTDTYKKGQLHRMLQIPQDVKIPFTLLEKIRTADIGTTVDNPTKIGKPKVKVTKLLKQRAVRALTWKRIGQKAKENKGSTQAKRGFIHFHNQQEKQQFVRGVMAWFDSHTPHEKSRIRERVNSHFTLKEQECLKRALTEGYDDYSIKLADVWGKYMAEEYKRNKGYNPDNYPHPYVKRGQQRRG